MHLLRALEVAFRELEVLTHYAELNPFRSEDVSDLTQHFIDAHIRTHVPRPVISGEQELQLFARLPGLPCSQHPPRLSALDRTADPSLENEVHHAAVPPAAAGHGA